MDVIEDYFVCEGCNSKDFKRIYNFSIRFHGVNFSDELIYDKVSDELYQCTQCKKTYGMGEIESCLADFRKKRKGSIP